MASLPLEPRHARCLLASFEHGCPREIIDLLALLGSAEQLLTVPYSLRENASTARSKFIHRTGDHMMLLNILRTYDDVCQTLTTTADRKAWCKEHYFSLKIMNQVGDARKQLRDRVVNMGFDWRTSSGDNDDTILLSMLEGLFVNTAMRMPDGSYRRANGNMVCNFCTCSRFDPH